MELKAMRLGFVKSVIVLGVPVVAVATSVSANESNKVLGQEFNPTMSLILDGRYTDISQTELSLPGFQLGGEAGLPSKGFSSGHTELSISANVDDQFYGSMTAAIVSDDGGTELELEEAFFETLKLGSGLSIKGGKFFSGFGYLNGIHSHAQDFADRPLAYDAILGGRLVDTGVQARWVAPTDLYMSLGSEITKGSAFPGGENDGGNAGASVFVKTGGDLSDSSSWQLGASYYQSEFDVREAGGHDHGHSGDAAEVDNELVNGEVDVAGVDLVYKWAPNGNSKQTNFKLQAEYIVKNEKGTSEFVEGSNSAEAEYEGKQEGFYVQGIYQFMPAWRVGLRYDHLKAENTISDFADSGVDEEEFLEESGLGTEAKDPTRSSIMFDYAPTHFSRVRLQYSLFENGRDEEDNIITLQYTMSLGAHGAHAF